MAKLPLPERGQPLDVSYIYQIANAVNDLSSQVSPSTNKYVTVDTTSNGKQHAKTSETRIIGGYIDVANSSTVTASEEKSFSYDFPNDFKYSPIVTATAIVTKDTPAGYDVSVTLKTVTTSRVEGVVKFKTAGVASVGVNLIMIGIPN